jgi:hypothetical protein
MKSKFKNAPSAHALAPILLAAVAVLVIDAVPMTAHGKQPLSASIVEKLDSQLILVVQKSRAESSPNQAATLRPDVYQYQGRALVEIHGALSKDLADQIASLGGQLVTTWGTNTTFRAWIPFAQLETLAGRSDIKSISTARPSVTHRVQR